jgi:WD40 repeat protein
MTFEAVAQEDAEKFQAVRPYAGAIKEPTNRKYMMIFTNVLDNQNNPSPPDVNFEIEHIYGYACEKSRQNLFVGSGTTVIYPAAAVGIIHDYTTQSQKFFGGGKVDNKAKNVSSDDLCHTDDILCIDVQGNNVATGQVGPAPVAFLWDASTGNKKQRFKLNKGARGIRCISISNDTKYVACVDMSNNHSVYVFDASSGAQVFTQEGDTADIIDV